MRSMASQRMAPSSEYAASFETRPAGAPQDDGNGCRAFFPRCLDLARMPVHRHVAGLIDDAVKPGADRRQFIEREVAFVCEVCAAIERDVRDGVVAGGEEVVRREILLHPGEKLGGF